jgi:predicted RNA-binding Zn ribbon-like protein
VRDVDAHPVELVLPDEPAPVRLMNTTWADRDGVFEALRDPSDVAVFLAAVGRPVPDDLGVDDVAALHDLRTALRALAGATGEPGAAVEAVNAALDLAPAGDVLAPGPEGWTLSRVDGSSFRASVSRLAREGAAVLADRSRPLRTCPAPRCGLHFVQHHQRRRWCSTECGNRVRAARYYRRHRGSGSPPE